MKVAAVMMVRNERHVIADCIGHLLNTVGVDRVYVADNDSRDDTAKILQRLVAATGRVVATTVPGPFRQSEVLTGLMQRAMAEGAQWLLPSDADEFLWLQPGASLTALCSRPDIGGYRIPVCNFVQARGVSQDWPGSIATMCVAAKPFGSIEEAREAVETAKIPFVRMKYPTKLLLRAAPTLSIEHGHHYAEGTAGELVPLHAAELLHAPIRSREDLQSRVEQGRRSFEVMPDPASCWHLKRVSRMDEAALAVEWLRNSFVPFRRLAPAGMRLDLRLSRIGLRQAAFRRRFVPRRVSPR